jgi:hypothetical protein
MSCSMAIMALSCEVYDKKRCREGQDVQSVPGIRLANDGGATGEGVASEGTADEDPTRGGAP